MLHPCKEVPKERCRATQESLQSSIEYMKRGGFTGCIVLYLPGGEYTVAFLDGNLMTVSGPEIVVLDYLLERAEEGEIFVFSMDKKIFSSYIGYLKRDLCHLGDGLPLNALLVDLVNKRHTGTIEVVNSSDEGLIFLNEGIPETAFYSGGCGNLRGTEALEGIVKMAEEVNPGIRVYSAVESLESLRENVSVEDMKMRGFFFNAMKSHIGERMGEEGMSRFNEEVGRSHYFDLVMYPMEEFLKATQIANSILGYTDFELGRTVYPDFKKSVLGKLVFFVGNINTPFKLARIAQMAWRVSVNYGERWVEEEKEGRIVFRMRNDGDRCERLRGILAGAMETIGYKCEIKETECEKRGGRFCEFVVEWDPKK